VSSVPRELSLRLGRPDEARDWFASAVRLNATLGEGPPTRLSRQALAALEI
jgi:hypothetical protein